MPQYCVVIGKPGVDPIAIAGAYPDEDSARAELAHYPTAHIDILIDPQALKEARGDADAPSSH